MIFTVVFGLIGAFISRLHGGGFIALPKVLNNVLWSLPFAFFAFLLEPSGNALIVFVLGLLKSMGHGRGFRMKEPFDPNSSPELVEKLIPDSWPVQRQKLWIMGLTGAAAVSGAAVVLFTLNPIAGFVMLAFGALKGYIYLLCESIFDEAPTEKAELLTGFVSYFGFALLWTIVR